MLWPLASANRYGGAGHTKTENRRQNVECRTIFNSDFLILILFLSQTTNNPCAHYILYISAKDFFDLPLPPFFKGPTFVALPRRNGSAAN
jgi:hypothetical protein